MDPDRSQVWISGDESKGVSLVPPRATGSNAGKDNGQKPHLNIVSLDLTKNVAFK